MDIAKAIFSSPFLKIAQSFAVYYCPSLVTHFAQTAREREKNKKCKITKAKERKTVLGLTWPICRGKVNIFE